MARAVAGKNGIVLENRPSLFTLTAPDYLSQYAIAPYKKVLSPEEKEEILARHQAEAEKKQQSETPKTNPADEGTCVLQ
jgi:hypothetical protein